MPIPPTSAAFRRVLVFRIGQLGDLLISLPALWAVREAHPDARIILLTDRHPHKAYVLAEDLFRGCRLFDGILDYSVETSSVGAITRPFRLARLLRGLRQERFDRLVYLAPSGRTRAQVERDVAFFRLAGIRDIVGTEGFPDWPEPFPGDALEHVPSEAGLLLDRLRTGGLSVPALTDARLDLDLGPTEEAAVTKWLTELRPDDGRPWIAVGPGSKMPAKVWPAERFRAVVQDLIAQRDVWPVVFGGPEDRTLGDGLLTAWGRGYNAAGCLAPREAAFAMRRCAMYVGNDTGTMHLAASERVPCVAVFSARDLPGLWDPIGKGHTVIRVSVPCEGCRLEVCDQPERLCMTAIAVDRVLKACLRTWDAVTRLA